MCRNPSKIDVKKRRGFGAHTGKFGLVWFVWFLYVLPRQSVWQYYVLSHMRQSWETMTSVSAGQIILTPTEPVGSGRPQRGSNPGPPHQKSHALPTELPPPPPPHTGKESRNRRQLSTAEVLEATTLGPRP